MNDRSETCPGCRERDARISALEMRVAELEGRLTDLEAENRELRARANRNSTNSSTPPSQDPPGAKHPSRPPTGRKPGGQPGHPGKGRSLLPREEVQDLQELFPDRCSECSSELPRAPSPEDPAPIRHQVIDIPEVKAFVREWVRYGCRCATCGKVTYAPLPEGVPPHIIGERLQAILGVLVGRYRISRREAIELLVDFFGERARLSVGEVSQLEAETSEALRSPYEEAQRHATQQPIGHCDETKWGRYGWLWVFVTGMVALFLVHRRRAREAFRELLPVFHGIVVTDRWGVYKCVEAARRALCWAHLARNMQGLVDRGGPAAEVGKVLLEIKDRVFALWKEFDEVHQIRREDLRQRMAPIRDEMEMMLAWGTESADPKAAAFCADLLDLFPALWTFVEVEGVPPTNNRAEQTIRPAVLWRHVSHGCQSDRGARFCERILTAAATMRAQGRSVLGFLVHAVRAWRTGQPAPSLLPLPAT